MYIKGKAHEINNMYKWNAKMKSYMYIHVIIVESLKGMEIIIRIEESVRSARRSKNGNCVSDNDFAVEKPYGVLRVCM